MARIRLHWSAPLWYLFLAVPSFAVENDFGFYPEGAQSCLDKASEGANCEGDTTNALNKCLCSNTNDFITNAAECIGRDSPRDVDATYAIMRGACDDSATPMALSKDEFRKASEGSTSSKDGSDSDNSDGSDNSDDSEGDRLSTGTTIGIAVGCSLVGAGIVAGIGWFLFRRYRKRVEESRPMLPQHNDSDDGTRLHADSSHNFLDGKSPPPYPYERTTTGSPAVSELPSDNEVRFEMEGSTVPHKGPIEMPAWTPKGTQEVLK
ncbi:hypothetical protein ACRE_030420 [Hapsidospora chrysogenum ATCC 11550]|uniref:Extracellular membrane protein CFEM domain-containing protein n=1 Tax=Hapsidospora chrysogenum (strain ATCC 11550 / CBS 779.69 / DSM 880 / IAM 14645 / JCM 23072 / IMI 49137) TaxID=857340 RepID=A0A086T9S7_HAPC1|nr:hypothetical protein ACRE_030420 [Hapsidospora chrysogenum ATCC 11550]